jgi:5'-3' exonuclease
MGIDNFHSWLKKTYPDCFIDNKGRKYYDHIYIDMNHVLHHIIYISRSELDFFAKLFYNLDNLLNNYFALKTVTFAIDGSSPYSKIKLQRKRRSIKSGDIDVKKLSSIHLTPGTKFMKKLSSYLNDYVKTRRKFYKFRKTKFYIFDALQPDEGEIKLLKNLHKFGKNASDTHLVIGNDADLIVICMATKPIKNIDICTKITEPIISIKKLVKLYYKKIDDQEVNDDIYNSNIRLDFNIVSIMMGNDYIPKLYYSKPEVLWESYIKTAKNNESTLIKYINDEVTYDYSFLRDFIFNINFGVKKQYRKITLSKYSEKNVKNYLEALLWCLNMYHTGKCSSYDFECIPEAKISAADILFYLECNVDIEIRMPKTDIQPIPFDDYAIFVMPKKAKVLIPKKYHNLMENELSYLYKEEECDICSNLKTKLSDSYKKMLKHKKANNLEEFEEAKISISELSKKLITKKKEYKFDLKIDKILNLMATSPS